MISVNYQADLTNILKEEQHNLLTIYSEILQTAANRDFTKTYVKLNTFKSQLKQHLMNKFKNLYVFIELRAQDHTEEDKLQIRGFRNEMNIISSTLTGIINKYTGSDNSINDETIECFIAEFSAAGGALGDKIQKEEMVLYPLYDKYGAAYGKRS
jgi:hypothetical protein